MNNLNTTVIVSSSIILLLTITLLGGVVAYGEKQQFTIPQNNFQNISSSGEIKDDPRYTDFYNPKKAFDGLVNEDSFWAQLGKANFDVKLTNSLNKAVCWAEIGVLKPQQKVPFNLTILGSSNSKHVNGILDNTITTLDFTEQKCIPNVNQILFSVHGKSNEYTAISEIKLYEDSTIPPIDPPVCPDGQKYNPVTKKCEDETGTGNQTGATITNSTVNLDITNSTVKVHADEVSEIVIEVDGGNVTTVTDNSTTISKNPPTTPIGTPLPPSEDEEEEDEDKEDDN